MSQLHAHTLIESLAQINDPRRDRTKRHLLLDILVIAMCATICGADSWDDIAHFGEAKQHWFARFLELPHGVPSHDTFRRVFLLMKPAELQRVFVAWVQAAVASGTTGLINIDGKHLRGSKTKKQRNKDGKEGLRMVSAWAVENRLVLGQVRTQEKSNEITAIPELLSLLELKGCIVTIDAIAVSERDSRANR